MGAISSLSTAGSALRRNPPILGVAFVLALFSSVAVIGQALDPFVMLALAALAFLLMIPLKPFLTGGIVGMSAEAVDGRTDFGTFVSEGKSNYLSLFGVYALFVGGYIAATILFVVFMLLFGFAGALALGAASNGGLGMGTGLGMFAVIIGIYLLFGLAYLLVFMFLQFFDVAIVVSGEGALGSIRRSAGFVRHNFVSTLGYTVIYLLLTLLMSVPGVVIGFLTSNGFGSTAAPATDPMLSTGPSLVETVPVALVTLIVSTLLYGYLYPYKVAFYTSMAESDSNGTTTAVADESTPAAPN